MKKLFLLIILSCSIVIAENHSLFSGELIDKDSLHDAMVDSVLADTVCLSDIVQQQIDAAKDGAVKTSIFRSPEPQPVVEPKKIAVKKESGIFEEVILTLNELNKKYLNIVIFILGSLTILGFIFGRKFLTVSFGSKKKMKKAINIIREEKPVTIQNKKLNEMRKKMSEASDMNDITERSVSARAKDLKVGKGEIILAAKIKAFQLSNVFK